MPACKQSLCPYVSLCVPLCVSVCLSVSLCVSLCPSVSLCVPLCPSVSPCVPWCPCKHHHHHSSTSHACFEHLSTRFADELNVWKACSQHALLSHICATCACFEYVSTLKCYKKSVFRWHNSLIHLMFKTCVLNTFCWCIVPVLNIFQHWKVIKRTCFGNTFRWYTQH